MNNKTNITASGIIVFRNKNKYIRNTKYSLTFPLKGLYSHNVVI